MATIRALAPGLGRAGFAIVGLAIGAAGAGAPLVRGSHARGTLAELIFLAAFAVAAGLWLSFVSRDRAGRLVVVNPAICYTFALMLSWGVVPAAAAHLASIALLTWRWRLPLMRGLQQVAIVFIAYGITFTVLHFGGNPGPRGEEWTSLHDSGIVAASGAAYLITFLVMSFFFAWPDTRHATGPAPSATGSGLLFNAALVVLSPVVAVTADISVVLAALLLLPLYATQRMARLSIERERSDRLDPLTRLANRTALREAFERAGPPRPEAGERLALLLLNLDRFRYLNDSLGYELGDELLLAVARRLRGLRTGTQTIARLGADEFAVLVRVPDLDTAEALASQVVTAVRQPIHLSGLLIEVTASIGVAVQKEGDGFVALLRHADSAMYDAKRRGNDVAVYHGEGRVGTPEGLRLLADFREALTSQEATGLALYYQPQRNLTTGAIDSFEALLRWTHPVRGPVDAETIIGLAEQTTVMNLLTSYVIDTVTAQIGVWRSDDPNVRVALNISARDLYSEGLVDQLAERVSHHRIQAHQLQVEVTESALTTDPVRARATLRRIAELGIDISLDDFGTGFSSLQQIRGTPLSEIKIDQSFVRGMASNRDDAAIVASTINLAHSLDIRAVAEGIEDEDTCVRLRDLGCELGQGWYVSRPIPADRVPPLIAGDPHD